MIKLTYRELDDYKYQVTKGFGFHSGIKGVRAVTEYVSLYPDGLLLIGADYAWNGSNWSSDKHAKIPSLVHDSLYQLMRLGLLSRTLRKKVDELYRDLYFAEAMSACSAKGWRRKLAEKNHKLHANIRYAALRMFGESATYPEKNLRGGIKTIIIKGA